LKLARMYNGRTFWFVYQCDFRGRIYCTVNGLSPQGTDFGKALLKFSEGKELGEKGELWFKVHGANMFGYDKVSYSDRIKWVTENEDYILAVGAAAINNRTFWKSADKPW